MHSEFSSEVNTKLPEIKKKKYIYIYLNSGSSFHVEPLDLEFNYEHTKNKFASSVALKMVN